MDSNISRRRVLGAGAATAAGIASLRLPGVALAKPRRHRHRSNPIPPGGRIDLHAHHIPPEYRAALDRHGRRDAGGFPIPDWSPESAIDFMDGTASKRRCSASRIPE